MTSASHVDREQLRKVVYGWLAQAGPPRELLQIVAEAFDVHVQQCVPFVTTDYYAALKRVPERLRDIKYELERAR